LNKGKCAHKNLYFFREKFSQACNISQYKNLREEVLKVTWIFTSTTYV